MALGPRAAGAALAASALLLTGCSESLEPAEAAPPAAGASPSAAASAPAQASTTPAPRRTPKASPTPAAPSPAATEAPRMGKATLTIPAIGLEDLRVVAYEGEPDDREGTVFQDEGDAASPMGPDGGTGPGQIGNYIVTAHRLSAGGPFRDLPEVEHGEHVYVTHGGKVYDYEIVDTMKISFRSEKSLAKQRAAVPGKPGATPTKAMITLSTCRTLEDHAEGNFWSDENGNPEHRINKIGVLVDVTDA
jgi:sortase A